MSRTPPSTGRTLLAIGAFLLVGVGAASSIALLHEPPPLDAARGLARRLSFTPIAEVQARTCEPEATDVERLGCLYALRGHSFGGEDPRDAAVVSAMIETARRTSLPELRADILRQLSGVTEPELLPYLIECLEGDPSEEVRSEAAETLSAYKSDERAEAALRSAAADDPSPTVRHEAQSHLE